MEIDKLNDIEEKLNAAYAELRKAKPENRGKWELLIIALQNEKITLLQELLKEPALKH